MENDIFKYKYEKYKKKYLDLKCIIGGVPPDLPPDLPSGRYNRVYIMAKIDSLNQQIKDIWDDILGYGIKPHNPNIHITLMDFFIKIDNRVIIDGSSLNKQLEDEIISAYNNFMRKSQLRIKGFKIVGVSIKSIAIELEDNSNYVTNIKKFKNAVQSKIIELLGSSYGSVIEDREGDKVPKWNGYRRNKPLERYKLASKNKSIEDLKEPQEKLLKLPEIEFAVSQYYTDATENFIPHITILNKRDIEHNNTSIWNTIYIRGILDESKFLQLFDKFIRSLLGIIIDFNNIDNLIISYSLNKKNAQRHDINKNTRLSTSRPPFAASKLPFAGPSTPIPPFIQALQTPSRLPLVCSDPACCPNVVNYCNVYGCRATNCKINKAHYCGYCGDYPSDHRAVHCPKREFPYSLQSSINPYKLTPITYRLPNMKYANGFDYDDDYGNTNRSKNNAKLQSYAELPDKIKSAAILIKEYQKIKSETSGQIIGTFTFFDLELDRLIKDFEMKFGENYNSKTRY